MRTELETDREANKILADPGTSRWLREALRTALLPGNDPVDILRDAEFLTHLLARRLSELHRHKKEAQ